MKHFKHVGSSLGQILLVSQGHAISVVYFVGQKYERRLTDGWVLDPKGQFL